MVRSGSALGNAFTKIPAQLATFIGICYAELLMTLDFKRPLCILRYGKYTSQPVKPLSKLMEPFTTRLMITDTITLKGGICILRQFLKPKAALRYSQRHGLVSVLPESSQSYKCRQRRWSLADSQTTRALLLDIIWCEVRNFSTKKNSKIENEKY